MTTRFASVSPAERRRAQEFAQLLEDSRPAAGHELESLVALAATLRPVPFAPRPEFRAALRESLVAECSARPSPTPGSRVSSTPRDTELAPRHRVRTVVATGVLVSLVGGVGAAAASTRALPGDSLYGVKRGIESMQLKLAHSDLSRGRELLEQADHRLSEAESLAASEDARSPETTARIAKALADMDAATRSGADALSTAYVDSGDDEPLIELDRFVVDQRERLDDLATLLGPDLRNRLTPLTEMLSALQARLDSLLQGTSASTLPAGATGSTVAAASGRESGDGWAVSRVIDQAGALVSNPGGGTTPAASGTTTGTGTGPLGDLGAAVTGVVDGLTPAPTSTSGSGGGGSGGLGNGGTASSPSLPTALPKVSVPAVPLPSLPVPLPTLAVPLPTAHATTSPKAPTPTVSAPLPSVHVSLPCVPVPPLTSC
jgi:Domain of unknown function (DUF5667)